MSCFPCFRNKDDDDNKNEQVPIAQPKDFTPPQPQDAPQVKGNNNNNNAKDPFDHIDDAPETENQTVKSYTFRELATATKNFRQGCLLGEGGFGKVFKGTLSASAGGQIIAVRQLDRNGIQASHEFLTEVSDLSFLRHPNLVKIIGYCADGEQRILVYEYMSAGSLKNRLFGLPEGIQPLDWATRMKIALGIAEGLEFLHEKANPPIIYRDLKSSNILLDERNNPRLSDYGLAKLVQSSNNKMHGGVMGGNGYGAPEYERQGELTLKSDVYSFGVVLLELITGRQAMDTSLPTEEQNLVSWAQPIFRDPSRFPDMADPLLQKRFPVTSLNQAVGVAAMCLQEEPIARPLISDISGALSFLAMAPPEAPIPARLVPILSSRVETSKFSSFGEGNNDSDPAAQGKTDNNNHSDSESENESGSGSERESESESESEDEGEDHKMHHNEDTHDKKLSSDFEYGNSSSDSSDNESGSKSKRLGSSSKRKSKKKSMSKKCSRLSSKSSRSSSSSLGDYSIGFSLRQDSTFPDRSDSMASRHDDNYGQNDSDSSGSDDDSETEEHYES